MFAWREKNYIFVDTPRIFIIAKLLIHKPGSLIFRSVSPDLYFIISTEENPGFRIESFAIIKIIEF